jgi:hypothetical protein
MRKSSPQLPISISPLRRQAPPGCWLLCNGETQSSASCFGIFTCASLCIAPGSRLLTPGSWLLTPVRENGCPFNVRRLSESHHAGALPILSGASGIEEGLVT